jgi:hypothetical protein
MVASEASDLHASDTCTWSATSSGLGAKDEAAVNNHSSSDSRTRLVILPHVCNKFTSIEHFVMLNVLMTGVCDCPV